MSDTPTGVLIVGAGPTGTALAIDLIRRGVSVRLIDKERTAFDGSRAKGVQPRTLEILEDLGAIDDILARGALYPKMGIHLGPFTIPLRMMARGAPGSAVPYPDTWLIPQQSTVAALHDRFESLGGRIELGSELTSFAQSPTGATAEVTTTNGIERITARYLVGADGGDSRVRKGAGIEFTGSTDEADRMLIVDAAVEGNTLSRNYWHVWPGLGGRFVGACPLPHSDLFQWMIRLTPDEEPPQTIGEITARIRSHTRMKTVTLRSIVWRSVFRPNIRLAETYRCGAVLLAGDAAHVHTPAGAQGMNTGIGDAYNLGWKLAQMLDGADDSLLDTYEAERRPIAAAVLGLSTEKYRGMGKLDPASLKRGADEKQLTLTYHGGPLAPADSVRTTTLRVGDRAPDADLLTDAGSPARLFEIIRGPHLTAIAFGPRAVARLSDLSWSPTEGHLTRVVIGDDAATSTDVTRLTDPLGHFAGNYGLTRDTLLIIRPDGYIRSIWSDGAASIPKLFSPKLERLQVKYFNPLMAPLAGRVPFFAVVHHRGRKSGKSYRTTVRAFTKGSTVAIVLVHGETDWVKNVLAAGRTDVGVTGKTLHLTDPHILQPGTKDPSIPLVTRVFLRRSAVLVATVVESGRGSDLALLGARHHRRGEVDGERPVQGVADR